MKIAVMGHKRIPSNEGGIEVVVGELVSRMADRGHSLTVYNRYTGDKSPASEYKGIKLVDIPTFKASTLNAFVYSVLAMVRACMAKQDIIHVHAEGPAAMVWLPHLLKKPVVVTIHGLDWKRAKWGGFASAYIRFGERMAARYADKLIVLSENAKTYFKETYGIDTELIPNGVSKRDPLPARLIFEKWGLRKDSYVLFVGRIVPEKRVEQLIKAFAGINSDKKLVIAGRFDERFPYCRELKELADRDERVIFAGFADGDMLTELYSNCSVYVLPSDLEGMSMSLLEALSLGCRVLVSDIKDNRGIADRYMTFFDKDDEKDLRDCLAEAIEEGYMEGMRREQMGYINDRFDWENITDRTLDIYRQAMGASA